MRGKKQMKIKRKRKSKEKNQDDEKLTKRREDQSSLGMLDQEDT